jgi:hypothetical protein
VMARRRLADGIEHDDHAVLGCGVARLLTHRARHLQGAAPAPVIDAPSAIPGEAEHSMRRFGRRLAGGTCYSFRPLRIGRKDA